MSLAQIDAMLMMAPLALAFLTAVPSPSFSGRPLFYEQNQRSSTKTATVTFASAAAGDWLVTYYGVSTGRFVEKNPEINRFQDHPALMVGLGAGIDLGSWVLWDRYVMKKHPKLGMMGLYASAAFRTYLIAKNVKLAQR